MPACCNSAPRKKLPPPTTMATALPHGGDDLLGDATNHLRIDADLSAAERLTRQFQQYPSWLIRRYSICHA